MTNLDDMMKDIEDTKTKFDSDFYKLQEGANRMRILSDFYRVDTAQEGKVYKGIWKGTQEETMRWIADGKFDEAGKPVRRIGTKGWAWAIIRKKDGDQFKIVQLSKMILGMIITLKVSEDWGFTDFPMDYDIEINAKNAGTFDVEYTVMPAKPSEVTKAELEIFSKKKPLETIVTKIYEKQTQGQPAYKDKYPVNENAPNGEEIPL